MKSLPLLGGPLEGKTVEYSDSETPLSVFCPDEPGDDGNVAGLYDLSPNEAGYVWSPGPFLVCQDCLENHII